MKSSTSTQFDFFRSTIEKLLDKEENTIRLSVENAKQDRILLILQRSDKDSPFEWIQNDRKSSIPITKEDALDKILSELVSSEGSLLIEQGDSIQRIGLRGSSFFRETVAKSPPILKQPSWSVGKSTHLDPSRDAPLLQVIGLMTPEGEIKAPMRKKFKQVNHFIELLHPSLPQNSPKQPFTIVDCGCGKSYLGFVLYWYLRQKLKIKARFYGVDLVADRIEQCQNQAEQLQIKDMQFECASIRNATLPDRPDLLISLHACDTATDEALALAVASEAKSIACAPCCQHELANQIEGIPHYPLTKHGLFTHRFADLLTDMARCLFLESHGYAVTVGEFVSVEETPKNLLIRARKGNSNTDQHKEDYEAFKRFYQITPSIDIFLLERGMR